MWKLVTTPTYLMWKLVTTPTYLMWKLVTKHSYRGTDSPGNAVGERSSDRQTIAEVVDAVSKDNHPSNGCYSGGHGLTMTVGMTVGKVQHSIVSVILLSVTV
jgi:hypothetical protein